MSLATFWMSRKKLDNVSDANLLDMEKQVDTMIYEFETSKLASAKKFF